VRRANLVRVRASDDWDRLRCDDFPRLYRGGSRSL
jgi:hypothetical protein